MKQTRPTPLRIYLDSSDFTDRPSSDLVKVREVLREYKRKGIIELWFSGLHVREAAHVEPRAKPHAVKRAEIIKDLCGTHALLSLDRLFPLEALAVLRGSGPVAEAVADKGNWLTKDLEYFARRLGASLVRGFTNRINSATAQALAAQPAHRYLASHNRKLIALKQRIAVKHGDEFIKDWRLRLELTPRFWRTNFPVRVFRQNLTEQDLQLECVAGIADVENFIRCWVDLAPHLAGWAQELRDAGQENSKLILELRDIANVYDEFAQAFATFSGKKGASIRARLNTVVKPNIVEIRSNQFTELLAENEAWFLGQGVSIDQAMVVLNDSPLGALPGFDLLWQAAIEQFTKNTQHEWRLLPSDLGDVLHFAYLPYVDIFRTDKHAAELARLLPAAQSNKVVRLATNLQEAIERIAHERGLI